MQTNHQANAAASKSKRRKVMVSRAMTRPGLCTRQRVRVYITALGCESGLVGKVEL